MNNYNVYEYDKSVFFIKLLCFVERVLYFLYDYVYAYLYRHDMHMRKRALRQISHAPIVYVDGLFPAREQFLRRADVLHDVHVVRVPPFLRAAHRAAYVYTYVRGGFFEMGRYCEYMDGVCPVWNAQRPVILVVHSVSSVVVRELCAHIRRGGEDPRELIVRVVYLSPVGMSEESVYSRFYTTIARVHFSLMCWMYRHPMAGAMFRAVYDFCDAMYVQNKIPMRADVFAQIMQHAGAQVTTSDPRCIGYFAPTLETSALYTDIEYSVFVGRIQFEMSRSLYVTWLYACVGVILGRRKIEFFDGACHYKKTDIYGTYKNVRVIEQWGHWDYLFVFSPFGYARARNVFEDIFIHARKNVQQTKDVY